MQLPKNFGWMVGAAIVIAGGLGIWIARMPSDVSRIEPIKEGEKMNSTQKETPKPDLAATEPEHISVQHILIGFAGSLPGKNLKRTKEESKKLAEEILAKAQAPGATFDPLVKQYTDDQAPGIYGMSNKGVSPDGEEFPRDQMVPAFGDVGFKLKVGEVGLADYDPATSPYGFHIIKRLK